MGISVVDLFSVGIGPSSSHTVGPMRAANEFIDKLTELPHRVDITLRGSLCLTGKGHGTDRAVLLGLVGWTPINAAPSLEPVLGATIPVTGTVKGPLGALDYRLEFDPELAPEHPNAMRLCAYDQQGRCILEEDYFSIGGGFILDAAGMASRTHAAEATQQVEVPYPFQTWEQLLVHTEDANLRVSEVMMANEEAIHGGVGSVNEHLDLVWETMQACVDNGLNSPGNLPGGLNVERRAPAMFARLKDDKVVKDSLDTMDWVNLWALAVNEENAAGGRIVTAPTNGAAGIIPATMHYAQKYLENFDHCEYLLTAGAVGVVVKKNASISGAEVGCQGEVGSASAMAAAGLAAVDGCSPMQIGNAAEIALEHNLGLTCDPVGGLVQIPCIERNAIGSVKAINAARLARFSEYSQRVTLDIVVDTMAQTGRDMMSKYKETSTGGLAVALGMPVALPEC